MNHKRREAEKKVKTSFTPKEWKEKIELTKGFCPHCHKDVGIKNLTLHHYPPLCKVEEGFVYTISDVFPLCRTCNSIFGVTYFEGEDFQKCQLRFLQHPLLKT